MHRVQLKGVPLKTPQGNFFDVPTLLLEHAIQQEWKTDPSPYFQKKPLTSLTATALDKVPSARDSFITYALQAISYDTLLLWSETPQSLLSLQEEKWAPLVQDINDLLGLHLKPTFSLFVPDIPPLSKKILEEESDFHLTGLTHLITLTSSFCLPYLILKDRLSGENAWNLAHLPEHAQQTVWGEDEETHREKTWLRKEVLETVRFLKLLTKDAEKA